MLSLQDGKARKLHYYHTTNEAKVSSLQEDFKQKKINQSDLFWAYHQLIVEEIKWPTNKSWEEIWKKLTKPQKILITVGHFIGQTNNGGVWQFLFNQTNYALAAAEALYELKPHMIWVHYEKVWEEFVEMANAGEYAKIVQVWNDQSISFEERWKAFKKGDEFIPTAKEIQEYFYTEDYKVKFFQKLIDYIHQNLGQLIKLEIPADKAAKIIKKKEAIPHFKAYLKEVYNQDAEEVKVYYTGRVTIDNQGTQLFLMQYKLADGYESIGITGYFTLHLEDAPMEEIGKMYKKYHKQELVNLYYGYYLVEQELLNKPKAKQFKEERWEQFLAKLQSPKKSQVPVNVEFLEYFKMGKRAWYIYKGDLLYNDDQENFPEDLSNVKVNGVGEKTNLPYRGEKDLIFHSTGKVGDGFGRRATNSPIIGKYVLYDLVGSANKLLKDNPWGF